MRKSSSRPASFTALPSCPMPQLLGARPQYRLMICATPSVKLHMPELSQLAVAILTAMRSPPRHYRLATDFAERLRIIPREKVDTATMVIQTANATVSRLGRDGLRTGAVAPNFVMESLHGHEVTFEEFQRGHLTLLIFSSNVCPPCQTLCKRLDLALPHVPDVRVLSLYNLGTGETSGTLSKSKAKFQVYFQRNWKASLKYEFFGTPAAYLISPDGRIAADIALGPDAIINLLFATQLKELLAVSSTV